MKEAQIALQSKCEGLHNEAQDVKQENYELKKSLSMMNQRIKSLEIVRLRSQIFFKTADALINKADPAANVVEIANKVGISISRSYIKSAVILPKLYFNDRVVAKLEFKDESVKMEFMKNRANIKKSFKEAVFFDVLSKENADLYKSARTCNGGFGHTTNRTCACPKSRKRTESLGTGSTGTIC